MHDRLYKDMPEVSEEPQLQKIIKANPELAQIPLEVDIGRLREMSPLGIQYEVGKVVRQAKSRFRGQEALVDQVGLAVFGPLLHPEVTSLRDKDKKTRIMSAKLSQ